MPAFQSLSKYSKICIFSPHCTMVLYKVLCTILISLYVQILCIRYCYVFLRIVVCTVIIGLMQFKCLHDKVSNYENAFRPDFLFYSNALLSFPSVVSILLPSRILCMACKNGRHCENSRMRLNLNFVI